MTVVSQLKKVFARCEARGVPVTYQPGWEKRGHGTMKKVTGHIVHHTATPASRAGDYPSMGIVQNGRSDLPGPLAQVGTGRSGRLYAIAGGISYHSGKVRNAAWANPTSIGNEMEGDGISGRWPAEQLDAAIIFAAELEREFGFGVDDCVGHREACSPPGRKIDPHGVNLDWFRDQVRAAVANPDRRWIGAGGAAPAAPAISTDLVLNSGDRGVAVRLLQERLTTLGFPCGPIDAIFGDQVKAAVIALQAAAGLEQDGIVGPLTRAALDRGVRAPSTPAAPAGEPAPAFPLPAGWYFGPKSGPRESVSGYYSYRGDFRRWQQRMADRGWKITVDGLYGDESARVARAFQTEKKIAGGADALVGPATWAAAWTEPVT